MVTSETLAAAFRVAQHGASMAMLAARIGNPDDGDRCTVWAGNKGSAAADVGGAPKVHTTGPAQPVQQVQAPSA